MATKRKAFTKKECAEIRILLKNKVGAPANNQKRIRFELRNKYGFWISFFTDEKPFTDEHFDELLKRKVITCTN